MNTKAAVTEIMEELCIATAKDVVEHAAVELGEAMKLRDVGATLEALEADGVVEDAGNSRATHVGHGEYVGGGAKLYAII